jgi:hypothetical protein
MLYLHAPVKADLLVVQDNGNFVIAQGITTILPSIRGDTGECFFR